MNQQSLDALNRLDADAARAELRKLCGCAAWRQSMAVRRPFADPRALHGAADEVFDSLADKDWLEAFACHPRVGDLDSLRMKFAGNREWSHSEQSGIDSADERTIVALARGNDDYFARFGYLFIVCATGKTAADMLALLEARLANDPANELPVAAAEQRKITHLRIDKLELPTP
ncbi:MAG: 2-oxo-4-hydroxy-4-carboxy-5-ureidoimidazoline decarboxylase [Lacipirellulaceae bacterium]